MISSGPSSKEAQSGAASDTLTSDTSSARAPGGGAATGGGINFQAVVTAIAAVHLLRGTPVCWLQGVTDDTPVAIWAETNGPGDDVRLELKTGGIVEVQAKKGLSRGNDLWTALLDLSKAVVAGTADFGVLAVAPDSSSTIRNDLSKDIRRLADGREDDLSDIGQDLLDRLRSANLPVGGACGRIRIRVIHGLEADGVGIQAAKEVLRHVCAQESDADAAWNALYQDAIAIVQRRGRWHLFQLIQLLAAEGNGIQVRDGKFPAAIAAKLTGWVARTHAGFSIAGLRKLLPLTALLPLRTVEASVRNSQAAPPAAALERYHASGERRIALGDKVYDAEWTGRFYRNTVVAAGPGLGKSTLIRKLAHRYASDGHLVLRVSLKSIAASMKAGLTFEDSLRQWGLDGSGVSPDALRKADLRDLVVLADGLDDCGDQHARVAEGLARFAQGYPLARIVATTRPIGYETAELAEWRHYTLLAPDVDRGPANLASLIQAATNNPEIATNAHEIAARELGRTAAAKAIAASPQMLGMAASVIVRQGNLPQSRPELYKQMISLFETSPRALDLGKAPNPTVSTRVLDILGWTLMHAPLAQPEDIVQDCAELLAPDLGVKPLAATGHIEAAISYWEHVGLVERLHHDGTTLMTFVHKTFAEFTAARYMSGLPEPERRQKLEGMVDDPAWNEVVTFAGGIGVGDEIVAIFVARHANGEREQFTRALALIGDPDAVISEGCARTLAEDAFATIEKGDADRFDLGLALADLALKQSALVGPMAELRLTSPDFTVRLVAWACAVAAGTGYHDPEQIVPAIRDLLPHIDPNFTFSLRDDSSLVKRKDRDLIQRLAFAALKGVPNEQIEDFIATELSHPAFGNFGFKTRLEAILHHRGVRPNQELNWTRTPFMDSLAMVRLLTPPRDWEDATRAMIRAVIDAFTTEDALKTFPPRDVHLVQFSALMQTVRYGDTAVSDAYAWTKPYDHAALRETLRVLIAISAIDAAELAVEAVSVIRRLDADPNLTMFGLGLPSVDVPEPDWDKAPSANPDQALLQKALEHPSDWPAHLAMHLLQAILNG